MIGGHLNSLQNAGLPKVLAELLARPEHRLQALSEQADGRYQTEGEPWFYTISVADTSPVDARHTELHLQYADIQIMLQGEEVIYYSLRDHSQQPKEEQKPDFFILKNPILPQRIYLQDGDFVVFLPGEPHKALCMPNEPGKVRKAVFKIPRQMLA